MWRSWPLEASTAYSDGTAPSLAHGSAYVANATRLPPGLTAMLARIARAADGTSMVLPIAVSAKVVAAGGSPSQVAATPAIGTSTTASSKLTCARAPRSAGVAVLAALPVARSIDTVV